MFEIEDDTYEKLKWVGIGLIAGYTIRGLFGSKKKKANPKNTLYLIDPKQTGILDYFADDENVYERLYNQLNAIPENEDVNIIIKTYGGSLTWCLKICETIKNRTGKTYAYVSDYAYSAGTIVALTSTELYMSKNASLSAIDPQYSVFSVTQVALKTIPELLRSLDESKNHMKHSFEKELEYYKTQISKYINKYYNIENIIDKMLVNSVSHEQIFFIDELKNIGITIKDWDGKMESVAERTNQVNKII